MKVVGIMGGSGSGKSFLSGIFEKLGARVVSADAVYHHLLETDSALRRQLTDAFGPDIQMPDGRIDRAALAHVVFCDKNRLSRLDEITHPRITEEIRAMLAQADGRYPVFVIDAPLLYRTPLLSLCDEVIFVRCSRDTRIERIVQRDGISRPRAVERIDAQPPDGELERFATLVVEGDLPEQTLYQMVRGVFH